MIYLLEKEGLGVKAQRICMDDYFQNIFLQKYLGVRRTTKSELLVVLIQFLVVEDTRTREFCCPGIHVSFSMGPSKAKVQTKCEHGELINVPWFSKYTIKIYLFPDLFFYKMIKILLVPCHPRHLVSSSIKISH